MTVFVRRRGKNGVLCRLCLATVIGCVVAATAWAQAPEKMHDYALPAANLAQSVNAIGQSNGVQVIYEAALLKGKTAAPISGHLTLRQALDKALAGSGLTYELVNDGHTVVIRKAPLPPAGKNSSTAPERNKETKARESVEPTILSTVAVTGTRIRGASPVGSPLLVINHQDIEESGYATAPQLLQSLPQNFTGGASEQAAAQLSTFNGGQLNISAGAGINLRGLGNDSTLVLLNGRRMVAGGFGNFVDISMLPLDAVKRVEILTDGASAIYGSDAVAGVVNFVLRKDYNGAETSVRDGSMNEFEVNQLFGKTWDSGNVLVNLNYYTRHSLDASDRSYASPELTDSGTIPSDLLPAQTHHSIFVSANEDFGNSINLFATVHSSYRYTTDHIYAPLFLQRQFLRNRVNQLGGTFGSKFQFSESWKGELYASYGRNHTLNYTNEINETSQEVLNALSRTTSSLWSLNAQANGRIAHLPGGDVEMAGGAQYRNEALSIRSRVAPYDQSRKVSAVFGEVQIPIIGKHNAMPGVQRLELDIAARHTHYSDFGDTTSPHLGVLWAPFVGFKFRASWGTSFQAPLLYQLNKSDLEAALIDLPDPGSTSSTGTSSILAVLGGPVPNLGPERAKTWTTGFDFTPSRMPGLGLHATYFNIDFRDRITTVDGGEGIGYSALFDPGVFSSLISRPASPEMIALASSLGPGGVDNPFGFYNYTNLPVTDAQVSIDDRLRNMASTKISGLDFNIGYHFSTPVGEWSVKLNSSTLLSGLFDSVWS